MKAKNETYIQIAQKALEANTSIWYTPNESILDAYNGQIAALGVSIALSGLRPALAIYYQEKEKAGTRRKANRRVILDLIAHMLTHYPGSTYQFSNSTPLFRHAITCNDAELKRLESEIIACSIALKQVVRTYKLVDND